MLLVSLMLLASLLLLAHSFVGVCLVLLATLLLQ
jgi:hypothetical protein